MAQKDGGPAFPRPLAQTPAGTINDIGAEGMTLRDYFAAAAMPYALDVVGSWTNKMLEASGMSFHQAVAGYAYAQADAMLAAREGKSDD